MTDALQRFLREKRTNETLARWLGNQTGWTVVQVAKHFNVSRKVVESWPIEVLPWTNVTPDSERATRRYRPTDVFAADAVLRAWARAKREGAETEFLAQRRQVLAERDALVIDIALGRAA